MKTIKLGQEFETPKTHQKELSRMQEQNSANINTINDLSELVSSRRAEMWEIIKQLFPELENYNCQYSSKSNTVKVIAKKIS